MKIRFTLRTFTGHFDGARQITHNLTRSRCAYLLRAARSRRAGNVTHTAGKGYRLNDCCYVITHTGAKLV